MICRHALIPLVFLLVGLAPLRAQDDSPVVPSLPEPYTYVGIIAGYGLLSNTTTLEVYPGSSVCGSFTNGDSYGLFVGLSYEYPILPFLQISARGLFAQRPATLVMRTDNGLLAYDDVSGTDVPFVRENVFHSTLRYLSIDAGLRFEPFRLLDMDLPFYVRGSVDAGDPIFGATFTQTEEIIQPQSRLFPDGTKRHVVSSGSLNDATTGFGASGAAGYEMRLDKHWFLDVEAGYRRGLNSVLNDQQWTVSGVYAALNLRYGLVEPEAKPIEPEAAPPVLSEPKPVAQVAQPLVIKAFNTEALEVQETVVTETYPLLPYVFFDSTSADLRERYRPAVDTKTFNEKKLVKSTLPIYYQLLNIVASRMRSHPNTVLRIVGTTDGRELGSASQRKTLAEERAMSVADYMVGTWGISEDRIQISARDLPTMASNPQYMEGLEENRRVEISADDPEILAPVVHARFMEYVPTQSRQVFQVQALHPELSQHWDATISKNNNLARVSGTGVLPGTIPFEVDSSIMVAIGREISTQDSLAGTLSVVQKDGSTVSAYCNFPIRKSQNQFELSRLSLIVFDFDRSEISDENKTMMQRFIREALHADSKVSITGSTDRLGELQYNKTLSQSRADEVQSFLRRLEQSVSVDRCEGIGASKLPYDNNLPEGRFYCRTVSIVVQTPITHH